MGLFDLFRSTPGEVSPHAPAPEPPRELLLYKYDSCGYCRRVLGHIQTLGIEVPTRDTMRDPGARDALYSKTSRTQVPCLFIDGEPLFESRDIMAWLSAYAEALESQAS